MAWLKRLLAPRFWRVGKKVAPWVISPSPGPHKKFECIPLGIIVRDILGYAETYKEAKKIIKAREILVDGRVRRDHKYPVGLMDVVSIPRTKENFRITVDKDGLKLIRIPEEEAKVKVCKIKSKTKVKGGKVQLNLHDGRNVLVDEKEDEFKTGDSLLIEIPSQKILEHIRLEEGATVLVTKGKKAGRLARVKSVTKPKFKQPAKVVCEGDGEEFEVLKEHVIVVGKGKPAIKLVE